MIQGCRPCGGECKPASAIWCINACQVFVPVHPVNAHFQFAAVHFMFPGEIDVCMRIDWVCLNCKFTAPFLPKAYVVPLWMEWEVVSLFLHGCKLFLFLG